MTDCESCDITMIRAVCIPQYSDTLTPYIAHDKMLFSIQKYWFFLFSQQKRMFSWRNKKNYYLKPFLSRCMPYRTSKIWPRWLSWMRRPTGDQEVAGSTPAEVGNILSWRLIMKYFLRSFSPFRWFKKGSCQFLAKECAQYWLTA